MKTGRLKPQAQVVNCTSSSPAHQDSLSDWLKTDQLLCVWPCPPPMGHPAAALGMGILGGQMSPSCFGLVKRLFFYDPC
ncbi:hypothetical protein DPEC_G00253960 [Dallia pectoralis]|uniref:Uncharacterized protein n=1 Tax=Dallia pectoralis TaxID=75939 RepID=A0ACC2FU35_DALPE|nr:hypothetical protein DPEC_G00253960 [Dallia pectoralis]